MHTAHSIKYFKSYTICNCVILPYTAAGNNHRIISVGKDPEESPATNQLNLVIILISDMELLCLVLVQHIIISLTISKASQLLH